MTALKMLGKDRVGGYLVVWGNPTHKDLQGEYFSPESDLGLDWYSQRPMLYHHGLDATMKSSVVGVIDSVKADQTGVWAEGQLNMRNQYVAAVLKLIQKGILGWSSGSLPHLVEVASDGHIKRWPIVEGSLTPTPAEPRRTDVHTIKSAYAAMGLDSTRLDGTGTPAENISAENAPSLEELCAKAEIVIINTDDETAELEGSGDDGLSEPIENTTPGGVTVNPRDIILATIAAMCQANNIQMDEAGQGALADQVLASMNQPATASVTPEFAAQAAPVIGKAISAYMIAKQNEQIAFQAAIINSQKAAQSALVEAHAGQGGTSKLPGFQPAPEQVKPETQPANSVIMRTKFADNSAEDMSYYIQFRNAVRSKNGLAPWQPNQEFMKEFADKAGKSFAAGEIRFGDEEQTRRAVKGLNGIKSDELNYSTLATGGDEWVPNVWASQVWEKARLDNVVLPQFKNVEMPSNPYELPVQSTDPTVSLVGETTAESQLLLSSSSSPIPDSKVTTAKVTLSAKKLALRAMFSAELDEDSIIPWVADLRAQAIRALEDSIDNVLINGDDTATATTNINLIDGTPAATAKYMAFKGLRYLPIITTTGNKFSGGGGAITLSQIRSARFSMDRAYSANPKNLFTLTHSEMLAKILGLTEFITMDKAGANATAQTGQLGFIDGMPLLISNELALTDSAGKIPAAGGTLGSLLVVYKPGWVVGFKRQINSTIKFFEEYDAYQMVATVRLAFINRDAEVAGLVYNSLV